MLPEAEIKTLAERDEPGSPMAERIQEAATRQLAH
jgi:hypothetical protein